MEFEPIFFNQLKLADRNPTFDDLTPAKLVGHFNPAKVLTPAMVGH
jgi:hypothetical protein